MRVTILGCGSSSGVPVIGCSCTVCASGNPRNIRSRVSITVEHEGTRLLVDTSPDLRWQAIHNKINKVDAILYTHAHADHAHGIDDVRSFNYAAKDWVDIYSDAATLKALKDRFPYAFTPPVAQIGWYKPCLRPHEIVGFEPFSVGSIVVRPFEQQHGRGITLGFRMGDFAYSTDVDSFPEASFKALEGVKTWVVDCLRYKDAPTHAHLQLTLEWVRRVKPELAVLTHMSHDFDYDVLWKELPKEIVPGYDGMVLEA